MGLRIVAVALLGWAAIVAVAWHLAAARIALCYQLDTPCIVRATAARDNVLLSGLTVALIFVVFIMIAVAMARSRRNVQPTGWASANRAAQSRLR